MGGHFKWMVAVFALAMSACQTLPETGDEAQKETEEVTTETPSETNSNTSTTETGPSVHHTPIPHIRGSVEQVGSVSSSSYFETIAGWSEADLRSALKSFQRSCAVFQKKKQTDLLLGTASFFGTYSDWQDVCERAQATPAANVDLVRGFFENNFLPVAFSDEKPGLVTGYYQPEIKASRTKTTTYSEPILTPPNNPEQLKLPRRLIDETTSKTIAYGRPIDVFFMQIQGSGVLDLGNGEKIRAAYAANNGYGYTSIGRVLIERGELDKNKASKASIEEWMERSGPEAARSLMNENQRYIFFKPEDIVAGEGPKGAQRVPLTEMASIAVDPKHYPYGLPVWLETQIPSSKGDYIGQAKSLLVITQDTGKAIRGGFRADLYFGSGFSAGEKAGVMKHPARWTILLPIHLALQLTNIS